MKILVIEDDIGVMRLIQVGLKENGFEVKFAYDGKSGLELAKQETFDAIILDIMLPLLNGIEVCLRIRSYSIDTPILMLTALDSTKDKIAGLDAGADDYLVKPFDFFELLARVRALCRRNKWNDKDNNTLIVGDLVMNINSKRVFRGNQEINLTAKEYALLHYFLINKERVLSRVNLATNIWANDFDSGTNIVDVYVNYLRNKIDKGFEHKLLHTIIGMGYILKEKQA